MPRSGCSGRLLITQLTGFSSPYLWLVLAILCGLLVWWLLYRGISFSTGVGIALGTIEIVIFLGISALLIINAGSKNTLSVFLPGADGLRPAFQGMVFTLLAFVGFEAAAPLGEEARDPKRTIPRAVMLSCILIGVFYAFNYYAATVFFGPDRMASEFYTFNNGDPWGYMADQVLPGIGSLLIAFAIINSSLANANSGATAATRSLFNMGRTGLITKWFGAIHATHRTPVNSIHFQAILALVLVVALGFYLGNDPLKVYVFIGYGLGLLFAGMYIAVNIAVIGFYLRERRAEFNWFKHLVVPILGIIFVIPAFATVLGIANVSIPILDIPLVGDPGAVRHRARPRRHLDGAWHRALLRAPVTETRCLCPSGRGLRREPRGGRRRRKCH